MTAPVASPRFRVAISRDLGTVVVTVHGELDLSGAALLDGVLADLIDGQGNLALVVDLYDASAPDASGLAVLVAAGERADRRGAALALSDPPDLLYQAIHLEGQGKLLRTTRHNCHRPSPRPVGTAQTPNQPERSTA